MIKSPAEMIEALGTRGHAGSNLVRIADQAVPQAQSAARRGQRTLSIEWGRAIDEVRRVLIEEGAEDPIRSLERAGRYGRFLADQFDIGTARSAIDVDAIARGLFDDLPYTLDVASTLASDWRSRELATIRELRRTKRILSNISALDGIASGVESLPQISEWRNLIELLP